MADKVELPEGTPKVATRAAMLLGEAAGIVIATVFGLIVIGGFLAVPAAIIAATVWLWRLALGG